MKARISPISRKRRITLISLGLFLYLAGNTKAAGWWRSGGNLSSGSTVDKKITLSVTP